MCGRVLDMQPAKLCHSFCDHPFTNLILPIFITARCRVFSCYTVTDQGFSIHVYRLLWQIHLPSVFSRIFYVVALQLSSGDKLQVLLFQFNIFMRLKSKEIIKWHEDIDKTCRNRTTDLYHSCHGSLMYSRVH